ncbi:MAG: hypothetical protein VYA30_03685 [Myxococcota bacterium]|nr:hypothetical protein [Myxococcota bacterium]
MQNLVVRHLYLGLLFCMCLTAGCGEDTDDPPLPARSLIDHFAWSPLQTNTYPHPIDSSEIVPCLMGDGIRFEALGGESTLAVDTDDCNFAYMTQPSLSAVRRGENIALRLWNWQLTAPNNATAKLSVEIGSHLLWSEAIDIPNNSSIHALNWTAPECIPEGTPIRFFVSNHGQNEYNFIELTAGKTLQLD